MDVKKYHNHLSLEDRRQIRLLPDRLYNSNLSVATTILATFQDGLENAVDSACRRP